MQLERMDLDLKVQTLEATEIIMEVKKVINSKVTDAIKAELKRVTEVIKAEPGKIHWLERHELKSFRSYEE